MFFILINKKKSLHLFYMCYGNNIIMLIIWLPNTPETVYWAPGHVSN